MREDDQLHDSFICSLLTFILRGCRGIGCMVVAFLSIYLWNRMPITFGFDYHNITRRPTLYYKGCQCSSVTTMMWDRYVGFFCDYNDVRQIGGFLLEVYNNVRKTSGFLLELCNDLRQIGGFLLGLQWCEAVRWFSFGTLQWCAVDKWFSSGTLQCCAADRWFSIGTLQWCETDRWISLETLIIVYCRKSSISANVRRKQVDKR